MRKENIPTPYSNDEARKHMEQNHTFARNPYDVVGGIDYERLHEEAHLSVKEGGDPFMKRHKHNKIQVKAYLLGYLQKFLSR